MNMPGKMHSSVGNRILIPAFWAISSARYVGHGTAVGEDIECLDDAGAELFRLTDDSCQAAKFLEVEPLGEIAMASPVVRPIWTSRSTILNSKAKRGCTEPSSRQREMAHRGAQSRLETHHDHIERIRKRSSNLRLSYALEVIEPERQRPRRSPTARQGAVKEARCLIDETKTAGDEATRDGKGTQDDSRGLKQPDCVRLIQPELEGCASRIFKPESRC